MAQTPQAVDKRAENLMVVLRESMGENKQDEALLPMTKARAKLSDGKEVEFEVAAFAPIGDMHTDSFSTVRVTCRMRNLKTLLG